MIKYLITHNAAHVLTLLPNDVLLQSVESSQPNKSNSIYNHFFSSCILYGAPVTSIIEALDKSRDTPQMLYDTSE